MKTALVLIDIQNDYFPGGAYELEGIEAASQNARDLLTSFRKQNQPVFHIQHVERSGAVPFFLPDTEGVKIHSIVEPLSGEEVIPKPKPNSFVDTPLREKLDKLGIDHIVFCGAMSHMCVDATTRAALDFGYSCTVVQDACATRTLEFKGNPIPAPQVHGAFMQALTFAGSKVIDLKEFLETV
ncbi:MAG: cysteine hydrolase family protein [Gemmataceae bacterium]